MNGEKAKLLRRLAEAKTVGKPHTEYDAIKFPPIMIPTPRGQVAHTPTTVVLTQSCTRKVYQDLKRTVSF